MSKAKNKFILECPQCGSRNINVEDFMKFVPDEYQEQINNKVINSDKIGILKFKKRCPKCLNSKEDLEYDVIIKGIKPSLLN